MADLLDFTNSDVVMGALTKAIGRLCLDVTGYDVIEADETIPKPEGPYILVDLSLLTPLDWATAEVVDEDGVVHTAHNYTASYTLTAYRGKPHWALSRVHQAFGLPFLREKYFPTGSPLCVLIHIEYCSNACPAESAIVRESGANHYHLQHDVRGERYRYVRGYRAHCHRDRNREHIWSACRY